MGGLDSIQVRVEGISGGGYSTDNLRPVMLQIEQALGDLIRSGVGTVIDLAAMPFSEQDERGLRDRLGRGEVSATIDAFGPSLIEETAYAGVWLIEHKDAEGRRLTLHVEVARVPQLLQTPADDLPDALAALHRANSDLSDAPTEDAP